MKKFLKNRICNFSMLILLSLIFTACESKTPTEPKPDLPDAPPPVFDSVVDARDGNVYKIVKIGEQWWMAENLRFKTEGSKDYVSDYTRDSIPFTYGLLYQWTTAMGIDTTYFEKNAYGDSLIHYPYQGLCPKNFHIPQVDEIAELLNYVDLHNGTETELESLTSVKETRYGGVDRYGFNHEGSSVKYATTSEIYGGWRKYMPYIYSLYIHNNGIIIDQNKDFFCIRCLKN